MRSVWRLALAVGAGVFAGGLGAANARAGNITFLGDFDGDTLYSSGAGVSADGKTVVGQAESSSGFIAYRWTAIDGLVDLGAGVGSFATGASSNGSAISGTWQPGSVSAAFRWTSGTGPVGLGSLGGSGDFTIGYAISGDGLVVVGASATQTSVLAHGFAWSNSSMNALPDNSATESHALGVSGDGAVAVGWRDDSGMQAVRWTSSTMYSLGDGGGTFGTSVSNGANSDGSVIVGDGSVTGGQEAFRWTESGGMVGLGELDGGGVFSSARAVNADGSVIVGQSETDAGFEAFVWDSIHGMRSLASILQAQGVDLQGWRLIEANGISADGTIVVGTAENDFGESQAFIAHISAVPLPAAVWAGAALLGGLSLVRRLRAMV